MVIVSTLICLKKLCSALIQCHLDYCCTAWFAALPTTLKLNLQVTQNKMVRFILRLPVRSHIGQSEPNMLKFLNVTDRVCQLRFNQVFKIKKDLSPLYLTAHFKQVNSVHNFSKRSNTSLNYFVPCVNSVDKTAFYYTAVKDWDNLPNVIKQQTCVRGFKHKVKTYLATRALKRENSVFIWSQLIFVMLFILVILVII